MNVLVIGSGGREHSIIWKLRQSQLVNAVYCAPGNAGTEQLASSVPLKPTDIDGLLKFALDMKIDLTVVGTEVPLVLGIVDAFEEKGLKIFGPRKAAARLEGSKVFAKKFMTKWKIPTAKYKCFTSEDVAFAQDYIKTLKPPIVLKVDGLAAGKGVIVCENRDIAFNTVEDWIKNKTFGDACRNYIIEENLLGNEVSIFALTDGTHYTLLAPAQDHKRILDGDLGKNTGGMGAYAPCPAVTPSILTQIQSTIIEPTLRGMREAGTPFRGCLYCGLMMTEKGPKVLEYNCRFGDPEAQVTIPLIDGDFFKLLYSIALGKLDRSQAKLHNASAVCVVMASNGYPDDYKTGFEIQGKLNYVPEEGVVIFHSGTKREGEKLLTAGGRVLGVTAVGRRSDLEETICNAYTAVRQITFDGAYFRSDIGKKSLSIT